MRGRRCQAGQCKWPACRYGSDVSRMPQTRHPEHPRNSQDVLASSPCQSRLLGATVGLHQGNHNRFVNMPLGLAKDPEDLSCWSKDCSSAFAGSPCDRGRGGATTWFGPPRGTRTLGRQNMCVFNGHGFVDGTWATGRGWFRRFFAVSELACAPEDQLPSGWSSTFFRVHFAGLHPGAV